MRLPAEIPYNPRAKLFVLILVVGNILWIGSFISKFPPKLALLASLISGALLVVFGIRRLLLKRSLILREGDMVIPTGFFQLRSTTVAYAQLSQFREYPFAMPIFSWSLHMESFTFRNGETTLQLSSMLMPDNEMYLEVRNFLTERAGTLDDSTQPGTPPPGNRYSTGCTLDGDGAIVSFEEGRTEGREVFRFCNEPQPKSLMDWLPRPLYGLARLPEFVVYDPDGKEFVRIRRTRRFPRAIFEMRDGKELRATIVRRHPFFSSYDIRLAGGQDWRFKLPLFRINFFGESSLGGRLLAWLDTHYQWFMVVDTNHDSPYLIHALAFIHRERVRVG